MLDAGLHDLLAANADALGAKFWAGELPQNQGGACGTYMCVGGSSDPTFDTPGMQKPRYQFDCYGDTALQSMTLRSALITFFNGFRGTLSDGTWLQYAELIDYIGPRFDQDRRKFYCMVEFYLHHTFDETSTGPGGGTVFGSPGVAAPTSALSFTATAGEVISAYKVVAISADLAYKADSSNLADLNLVVGVAIGGVVSGGVVTIQTLGLCENLGWNWTIGVPVFLGSDGTLTQTAPTTGFLQTIGTPVSHTEILIELQPPIVL